MAMIDADYMNDIKNRLNVEFAKRNGYGSLSGYNKPFSDTVAPDSLIKARSLAETKYYAMGNLSVSLDDIRQMPVSKDNIETLVSNLETKNSSTCSGFCTGYCTTTCAGTNTGAMCSDCSGTCKTACTATCATGCTDNCTAACTGCQQTCTGTCCKAQKAV